MLIDVTHVFIGIGDPLWVVVVMVECAVLGVGLVGEEAVGACEGVNIGTVEFDKVVMMMDVVAGPADEAYLQGIVALVSTVPKLPACATLQGLVSSGLLAHAAVMAI